MAGSLLQDTPTRYRVEHYNLAEAQAWLEEKLSTQRLEHSLGAFQKAVDLSDKFHLSPIERDAAAMAGMLHDSAKLMAPDALLTFCQERFIQLTDADRANPQVLHAIVGAHLVREQLGIQDEPLLNAIRYHTTGRAGMSRVEKVVYIADKIEGNTRNPLYIKKMTEGLNPQDPASLDRTMLYILDSTIQFLLEKGQLIHPLTIEARNDVLATLKA